MSRIRRPRREFGRRASTAVTQALRDDACLTAIVRSDSRQALRVVNDIARSYRLERCFLGALIGAQYPHRGLVPTDHELLALIQNPCRQQTGGLVLPLDVPWPIPSWKRRWMTVFDSVLPSTTRDQSRGRDKTRSQRRFGHRWFGSYAFWGRSL